MEHRGPRLGLAGCRALGSIGGTAGAGEIVDQIVGFSRTERRRNHDPGVGAYLLGQLQEIGESKLNSLRLEVEAGAVEAVVGGVSRPLPSLWIGQQVVERLTQLIFPKTEHAWVQVLQSGDDFIAKYGGVQGVGAGLDQADVIEFNRVGAYRRK